MTSRSKPRRRIDQTTQADRRRQRRLSARRQQVLGVPADSGEVEHDEVRPSGLRRFGRLCGIAGGGVALLGAVAVGLFPTQTFITQRASTSEAEQRLSVLRDQNAAFEERIDRLQTAEEIERLAREQYNLAYPGEEAYAVLPAPLPPLELPEVWPFGPLLDP